MILNFLHLLNIHDYDDFKVRRQRKLTTLLILMNYLGLEARLADRTRLKPSLPNFALQHSYFYVRKHKHFPLCTLKNTKNFGIKAVVPVIILLLTLLTLFFSFCCWTTFSNLSNSSFFSFRSAWSFSIESSFSFILKI